jgi:uncharacterized protein YlxP (DUF503 family)
MQIAAALIELFLSEADSIKARRRVANAVKTRLRARFNVSTAEVGDQDDRHSVLIGCVMVGIDPRHLRSQMEKVVRHVEKLGLAEIVGDDISVLRLDEIEAAAVDEDEEAEIVPEHWRRE